MKISELPKAAAVNDTDVIPLVQDGETKQASRKAVVGAVPNDLKLTDRLLQLTANGEAVGGGITLPDFNKFELWNDITLSEDTQLIKISKTDDGKPFKIKKLFLYFFGKFNSAATLCLKYNNGQIYQSWKMVLASTKTDGFWILSEKIAPGLYLSKYPENVIQVGDDGAAQGLGKHIQSIKADFHYDAKGLVGTSIIFGAHGSYTDFRMLTGSRILVWGVQDDD